MTKAERVKKAGLALRDAIVEEDRAYHLYTQAYTTWGNAEDVMHKREAILEKARAGK